MTCMRTSVMRAFRQGNGKRPEHEIAKDGNIRGVPRIFRGGGGVKLTKLTSQTSARLSYFRLGLPV